MIKMISSYRKMLGVLLLTCMVSACAAQVEQGASEHLGDMKASVLLNDFPVFSEIYHEFGLNEWQKQQVQSWPSGLTMDIYFGTWCHDSEREVPKMIKILEQNDKLSSNLIALDTSKSEPAGRASLADVQYTPTFILYLGGKEIGRIIERPAQDLISDINQMLVDAKASGLVAASE